MARRPDSVQAGWLEETMDERIEVIDAFVDGERVDAPALKRALADEAGRDYFVDAWLLREGVQDDMSLDAVPHAPLRARRERGWLLALAASMVCAIGGYVAGTRLSEAPRGAGTGAPPVVESTAAPSSFPAPSPTRAITVEFSTDGSAVRGGD
jgi:hypothetical protein